MTAPNVLIVVTSHGDIDDVPTTGIWFSEFSEPLEIFARAGVRTTVASPRGGPAPVDPRGYPSKEQISDVRDALAALNATTHLSKVNPRDFDAVFFPGGHGPMFDLATLPLAKRIIANFWTANKPVSAVCHGPASLLDVVLPGGTTLLRGKRVTGFTQKEDAVDALFSKMPFSLQERMEAEGAEFVEKAPRAEHVEVDGLLVTGQNPASATITAKTFLEVVQARAKVSPR
jgi:putative intracellular protease/amidase